jgi:hypothetical protein
VASVVTVFRDVKTPYDEQSRHKRCDVSEEEFERSIPRCRTKSFGSGRKEQRVEFGCPGHGKGPWDGLGAMVKTKVTLDIMHDKEHTMTGKITSPILVTQHLRVTFCKKEWIHRLIKSL